jgi:L-asparaginase / beta-aspartyl-peptidase
MLRRPSSTLACFLTLAWLALLAPSASVAEPPPTASTATGAVDYAIAIHGGAGVIGKDMAPEKVAEYRTTLQAALQHGRDRLAAGAAALDVVEEVVRMLEDSPLFNAGKGAVFDHEGRNELDASIMDGRNLACGAVAGVTTVKNPVRLARAVMEHSPHVFMVGPGAEAFAAAQGLEIVDPSYFFVQQRYDQLQKILEAEKADAATAADGDQHGTVGCVVRDKHGNLAAATSTGGLTNKRFGRVGDSPVIGAGTYADDRTVAVSCTGQGEEFIRHNVAHTVSALVELAGLSVQEAAEKVIHGKLQPGDGGLIAVDHDGKIALVFNTPGMFRGAADSTGRFEVRIWED